MKTLLIAALVAASTAASADGLTRAADKKKIAPAADNSGAQFSDDEIRSRIHAFLGSIDTPIVAAQWAALGPRAEPVLAEIARNKQEFSSRRARALDGLGAGKWAGSGPLMRELAHDETAPVNVRFHAVRGLSQVLAGSKRSAELVSLLQGAKDSRVRAVAAEQLSKSATGCAQVQQQVARENEAIRNEFHRATAACAGFAKPTP